MKMLHFIQPVLLLALCISGSPFKITEAMTPCSFSSDCSFDECCAISRDQPSERICAKKPQLYDVCSPVLFPGLDYSCPCSEGLTCAKMNDPEGTYNCVPVPEMEEEKEQK